MALVIAGERSGVGKTTVTLTLLASLCRRGITVQSFKVGPDYIDPMFHQHVTGRACRNLDPVLTSEAYIQQCFARHSQNSEYALVEGVMGLFDGIKGTGAWGLGTRGQGDEGAGEQREQREQGKNSKLPITHYPLPITNYQLPNAPCPMPHAQPITDFASTAHIARLLNLPVVLVIDCSRLSGSVAAIAHGYRSFDPRIKIAGLILNRVGSDRHLSLLKDALESLQLPILGVLRRQDNITIPDRHLGLVPTAELPELDAVISRLADLGDTCFDWERLLPMLGTGDKGLGTDNNGTRGQDISSSSPLSPSSPSIRIAVARDRAFNFYYQDNLDLLQELGAELVFWSPLGDSELPKDVQGIYFGGGFPEVFAQQLAENISARDAVKTAIMQGIPVIAECGGLMYLCEQIIDFAGESWPMVGILPTSATMDKRLTLGYRRAVALQDNLLVKTGKTVYGHEFHRSHLTLTNPQPLWETYRYDCDENMGYEGWSSPINVYASYVHLHWGNSLEIPQSFIKECLKIAS
ncbi:cobyrinic acid a,c-diamide synthase [Tolypothrix tenuis PCC 7101]|uniref:Cobyrinate a,c-diamide synthase n=1 Tax=Tolypothrix tenuis PCC 7101 TaxID=231146 RepID=A0A1Z4N9L4_9CYAN|nr:cobyrinate a,c-diamide synthase [Aulosira sp. FACHB-113]BAZ02419.1 cobyrinic acid a,c-diamide synthase [Tolypothrix tenuis PCC 7101]BAZ73660.1 cobyrinic acid a,c-diamide synthase [Aulosira laxa NIES-50]